MNKISISITLDLLKNKAILLYGLILAFLGWGMFLLESQPEKAILALLQVTLIILPLVTSVFAIVYYYNSAEFIHLLLIQPVRRGVIIRGVFIGLSIGFIISYFLGLGVPLLLFYPTVASGFLIIAGLLLSLIFTGIALWVSTHQQDKTRSIGIVLLLWVFFTFIYEGIQLLIMYQLAEYPIEQAMLWSVFFNPVSIARILVVMQTEAAALLGLSGAVFQDFFGSIKGSLVAINVLILWVVVPYFFSRRSFLKRDF